MDTTFIAMSLQVSGWGLFFYTLNRIRRVQWRRGPLALFWTSTALLGCSTFCFAAAPLLNWGQIAWLMLTGGIASAIVAGVWGALSSAPQAGTAKAMDVERAEAQPVSGWSVPSLGDMLGGGTVQWTSPTIAGIEAMEVA